MRAILILAALFTAPVFGAKPNLRYGTELAPQYRRLNQEGFSNRDDHVDGFFLANAHLEWSLHKWILEAKPEVRGVFSAGVNEPMPDGVSVQTSRRTLNTHRTLFNSEDGEMYFDFDRLNTRYTLAKGELFLGRRPISLGVLRFFPVWNKITLPLIFQPGPEWIENPDVVGGSVQHGRFSYRAFWTRGNEAKRDDLALFESRFFGDGVELQAIGGYWWEHAALGLAGAFDALQSTLRVESLYLARFRDEPAQLQLGLGLERALSEKWTLVSEALYQSAGLSETQNRLAPNRFMALAGKFYLLPYLSYQLNALWTVQLGGLAALNRDNSYMALGGFEYSVSDKTSLTLKVKWPLGPGEGEFGSKRVLDPFGNHLGASSTAILHLQSTF